MILKGVCSIVKVYHLRPERLSWQVLPLFMKPAGQTELAFETGLVFLFRYDLRDGELQVSFRESLNLSLVVGVHSLLFMSSQIQKEHSREDLLNFLVLFLIRILMKARLLRQHKTENYPLAPTSTSKSSTGHPLDSIVVFNAKYAKFVFNA